MYYRCINSVLAYLYACSQNGAVFITQPNHMKYVCTIKEHDLLPEG